MGSSHMSDCVIKYSCLEQIFKGECHMKKWMLIDLLVIISSILNLIKKNKFTRLFSLAVGLLCIYSTFKTVKKLVNKGK